MAPEEPRVVEIYEQKALALAEQLVEAIGMPFSHIHFSAQAGKVRYIKAEVVIHGAGHEAEIVAEVVEDLLGP